MIGIQEENEEAVQILLHHGADINYQIQSSSPYNAYSPLHFAIIINSMSMCTLLLNANPKPFIKSQSSLYHSYSSDFDSKSTAGLFVNPLDFAIQRGNENIAQLLREFGHKDGFIQFSVPVLSQSAQQQAQARDLGGNEQMQIFQDENTEVWFCSFEEIYGFLGKR